MVKSQEVKALLSLPQTAYARLLWMHLQPQGGKEAFQLLQGRFRCLGCEAQDDEIIGVANHCPQPLVMLLPLEV